MVFIRKIRGIFKNTLLEHIPNFSGHFCFNGRANEKRVRLELLLGKRFMNSIQRRTGGFPMLIRTGGINATFEFAERDVCGRCIDNFTTHFGERTIEQ